MTGQMLRAEHLRKAAELIREPERWCRGNLAEERDGVSVEPRSERAVRWCAFGALRRVVPRYISTLRIVEELDKLARAAGIKRRSLSEVNDFLGHDVALYELDVLARAAERLEQGER